MEDEVAETSTVCHFSVLPGASNHDVPFLIRVYIQNLIRNLLYWVYFINICHCAWICTHMYCCSQLVMSVVNCIYLTIPVYLLTYPSTLLRMEHIKTKGTIEFQWHVNEWPGIPQSSRLCLWKVESPLSSLLGEQVIQEWIVHVFTPYLRKTNKVIYLQLASIS